MEENRHEEIPVAKERQPLFNVHKVLAKQGFQPCDSDGDTKLLQKREEQLRCRLIRALKRHYPASRIPAALAEIEKQVRAGANLEERVWVLESLPTGLQGLDRQVKQIAAQVKPMIEATTEALRMASHLQEATKQLHVELDEVQEKLAVSDPQVEAIMRAAETLGTQSMFKAATVMTGGATMSRSIFGDLNHSIYGNLGSLREMERALGVRREMERAIGVNREIERVFDQERQYRKALGLDSAYENALQDISRSRGLLEAALGPLPNLSNLSSFPGSTGRASISGTFRRLNKAIGNAPVLGKAESEEKSAEGEPSERESQESNQELEPRLVKVMPAEVLTQIRLPLSELNRVLRHPEAMRMLTARDFERFIATLVEQLGFEDVVLTPPSGDQGRDVLATKRVAGIPIFFAFECKRYAPDRLVGPEIARALLGTIMHGPTRSSMGVLVTTSTFTPAARQFILTEPVLDGKDFDEIVDWLKEYSVLSRRKA